MEISRVAILGPGLLGGSLALELAAAGWCDLRLWGRRREALDLADEMGVSGLLTTDMDAACAGADLVVMATPVGAMPALAKALAGLATPPQCVTDMGSVKGVLLATTRPVFHAAGIPFVGSHPMCGSEQQGMTAARLGFFQGAACIVTPEPDDPPAMVRMVEAFWQVLGCRVVRMGAAAHDAAVARVSHLPHVVAAALAAAAVADDPGVLELAAGGFRDTTRVAGGSPGLWCEILMENRAAVLAALAGFEAAAAGFRAALAAGDAAALTTMLEAGRVARAHLPPA
jgi:prephenate dehydrogenase